MNAYSLLRPTSIKLLLRRPLKVLATSIASAASAALSAMLLLAAPALHADTADFAFGDGSSSPCITSGSLSWTNGENVDGVTFTLGPITLCPTQADAVEAPRFYYIDGWCHLQLAPGASFTLQGTPGTIITTINFLFSDRGASSVSYLTASEGELRAGINNSWTGEANALTFTVKPSTTKKMNIDSVVVVYTAGAGGTDSVEADVAAPEGATEWFDLTGRRVSAPDKGIYLMRHAGHTVKALF